ncbi:MAG: hypothetical protein KF875_11405 [Trueperaceae bacterium]|nr:hypothetical protein [Trueperaceae bacterium]MCC6310244.1 hypothetical protein [Trueperaceae bacterium]MCW5818693.1 hypothetical protein [Trueperaceae bacterium]
MADAAASAGARPTPPQAPPPLDDVMLAMDVVDTLRHRERLVEAELASEGRDEAMLESLRNIYASQGIAVSDAVLQQGVAALREGRFVYAPPARGPGTRWAYAYVNRGKWGKLLLALLVVAVMLFLGYDALVRAPHRTLVRNVGKVYAEVVAQSQDPSANLQADTLYGVATAAIAKGDDRAARTTLASLEALQATLSGSYTLRIATDTTGVWRVPDLNQDAANYYIIVEPIDRNGNNVAVTVTNEETGRSESVRRFGLRVSEATFEAIKADKLDDGIIQNDVFGEKRAGYLQPVYRFDTTGAAITSWD